MIKKIFALDEIRTAVLSDRRFNDLDRLAMVEIEVTRLLDATEDTSVGLSLS